MTAEEGELLRQENEALREQVKALLAELAQVRAERAAALERNGALEPQPPGPPNFVKPNRAEAGGEKPPRRQKRTTGGSERSRRGWCDTNWNGAGRAAIGWKARVSTGGGR